MKTIKPYRVLREPERNNMGGFSLRSLFFDQEKERTGIYIPLYTERSFEKFVPSFIVQKTGIRYSNNFTPLLCIK